MSRCSKQDTVWIDSRLFHVQVIWNGQRDILANIAMYIFI